MSKTEPRRTATWRIVLAFILDAFTAFWIVGYAFAFFTGGITPVGFQVSGWPAFFAFLTIIAYFVVFNRYLGGTIWKRLLGAGRNQR